MFRRMFSAIKEISYRVTEFSFAPRSLTQTDISFPCNIYFHSSFYQRHLPTEQYQYLFFPFLSLWEPTHPAHTTCTMISPLLLLTIAIEKDVWARAFETSIRGTEMSRYIDPGRVYLRYEFDHTRRVCKNPDEIPDKTSRCAFGIFANAQNREIS